MENELIDKEEKIELKLKTICDYLLPTRFDEISVFSEFEKCFKPLFFNTNISLEVVFDYIVGTFENTNKKRKYISYARLYKAYLNYILEKNKNNIKKDISIFFNTLLKITKIVEDDNILIGKNIETNFSSKDYQDDESYSMSKVLIICNDKRTIIGIKLEYNDQENVVKMYCNDSLYIGLELNLTKFDDTNDYIKYRDSITHIFGTFDKQITSLGFKCISGELVSFGKPEGKSFLLGCYGKKLQYLDLAINDYGIIKLEAFFVNNQLINRNIEKKEDQIAKIYRDEKLLLIEKDKKKFELLRNTNILNIGKNNDTKFEHENIFIKPIFKYIYENNMLTDGTILNELSSTTVISKNKDYSNVPNPLFLSNNQDNIMIPNPFYPKELEEKEKVFKDRRIINKAGMYNTIIYEHEPKENNIKNKLSKTNIITFSKEKLETKKNYLKIKEEIEDRIYKRLFEKGKDEIDTETQIALDIIFPKDKKDLAKKETNEEKNEDKNILDEQKEEMKKEKEEKKEIRIDAINILIEKLGLNNDESKKKIINIIEKENQNIGKIEKKITLDETSVKKIEDEINEIKKKKSESEDAFVEMIEILIKLNKIKEKDNKEKDNEKNNIDEKDEILPNIEENNETLKEEEIKEEKAKMHNKNINEINNHYGRKIDEIISENEKEIEQKKIKEHQDFIIVDNELNILIESFYKNKKRDNNIKIYGGDKWPRKFKIWKEEKFTKSKALGKRERKLKWIGFDEANYKNYAIFIDDPLIENIKQSKHINNCYFLAALGALCKKDGDIVKNMFHSTEITKEGVYGIYFYMNGEKQLVLIDNCLAYDKNNNLYFGSSFNKCEMWVSLIEKAWAKIKGGYAKIYEGLASEAFDFLTGAYTKSIKIKNRKKNKLWEDLKNANEFPCCAGTITTDYLGFFDGFSNTGLQGGHDYTILEVNEENGRTVKIRDPYGEKKRGILTITFKEFIKYFLLLEINYFKKDFIRNFIKIPKEESFRCQFIKINNEIEDNEIYLNLYQDKEIDSVYSYIMLIKKEENTYNYIESTTSLDNGKYQKHIALNKILLKKGTYYLCCDINYRFLEKTTKINNYSLNIFSKNKIKVENATEQLKINEKNKILSEAFINYLKNKTQKDISGIKYFSLEDIDLFPFYIYYFINYTDDKKIKIKFNIIEANIIGKFSFYNNIEASEFDKSLVKELSPKEEYIILIMNNKYSVSDNKKKKDLLDFGKSNEIDNTNQIFFKIIPSKKEKYNIYKLEQESAIILGIENTTENEIKLVLKTKNCFNINPKEWNYKEETFKIFLKKGEKKVINLRKKEGKERISYSLELDKN